MVSLVLVLMACAEKIVRDAEFEDVEARAIPEIKNQRTARSISYRRVVFRIKRGTHIGSLRVGSTCRGLQELTLMGDGTLLSDLQMRRAFNGEAKKGKFKVVGGTEELFDDPKAGQADYLVGGSVQSVKFNACGRANETIGRAFFEIEWEIYNSRERRVIHRIRTRGTADWSGPNTGSRTNLLVEAFRAAAHNLLADAGFHRLITTGKFSRNIRISIQDTKAKRKFKLTLAPRARGRMTDRIEQVQGAVATIILGKTRGTGFFIDRAGYVLTNAHVVKDARKVKVRLKDGRELTGNVVALDRGRDVALIKTGAVKLSPLPLLPEMPRVGANVFVIGSPLGETFESTLSRGIVSGKRKRRGMNFIQSDADILPGSSGGPLLDSAGNVIGIAVGGIVLRGAPTRLNFFIPIGEAIRAFNGKIEGRSLALRLKPEQLSPALTMTLPVPAPRQSASRTPAAGRNLPVNFLTVPDGKLTGRQIRGLLVRGSFSVTTKRSSTHLYLTYTFDTHGVFDIEAGTMQQEESGRGSWRIRKPDSKLCLRAPNSSDRREICYTTRKNGKSLILSAPATGENLVMYAQ